MSSLVCTPEITSQPQCLIITLHTVNPSSLIKTRCRTILLVNTVDDNLEAIHEYLPFAFNGSWEIMCYLSLPFGGVTEANYEN